MARIAVRGAPRDPGKGPIRYRWDLFKFEVRLRWLGFVSWWQTVYVRLLTVSISTRENPISPSGMTDGAMARVVEGRTTAQRLHLIPSELGELQQYITPA